MAIDALRLQQFSLFASLNDQQRQAAASQLEERAVDAGARLSAEGGSGYFFFLIEQGTARVTRGDETLADLGPGDFFGEAAILKTKPPTRRMTRLNRRAGSWVVSQFRDRRPHAGNW